MKIYHNHSGANTNQTITETILTCNEVIQRKLGWYSEIIIICMLVYKPRDQLTTLSDNTSEKFQLDISNDKKCTLPTLFLLALSTKQRLIVNPNHSFHLPTHNSDKNQIKVYYFRRAQKSLLVHHVNVCRTCCFERRCPGVQTQDFSHENGRNRK